MRNWKCFSKKDIHFDKSNIINWRNGKGKTSVFEGILFCLYGKRPTGFTFNSLRLDRNKECTLRVDFDYCDSNGVEHEVKVKRKFVSSSSSVVIKQDDQVVCSTGAAAFDFINEIIPYDIISVLWSPGTLQSSEILNPDFLVRSLFKYVFKDPQKIEKYYKYEIYNINKSIKSINISKEIYEKNQDRIEEIKDRIADIKARLKERSASSFEVGQAQAAKKAYEELEKIKIDKQIDERTCSEFKSLVGNQDIETLRVKIKEDIKKEESKISSILDNLQPNILRFLLQESSKGKCIVCGGDWSAELSEKIDNIIKKGKIDQRKIERLKGYLELLLNDPEQIENNIKYKKLKAQVNYCKNFEEIINNYNEENNRLWEELERIENEKEDLDKQNRKYDNLLKEKEKLETAKKKMEAVQQYISDAGEYYSRAMTENGSDILCELNSKYDQIFLDENQYNVTKVEEEEGTINLLSAAQLSSGERTLVGISLILSAHNLFFPDIPLLFDESFSALDRENIAALKEYFRKNKFQVFIITHDKFWVEGDSL